MSEGVSRNDVIPSFKDSFGPYFGTATYADVTVVLHSRDGAAQRFPAHKIMLCAQSVVLRELIAAAVAEGACLPEIHIDDVDPWIGLTVLRTLYTQDASHLDDDVAQMMVDRFGSATSAGAQDERVIAQTGFVLRVLAASRRLGIKALEVACYRSVQIATNDTTVARILAAAVRDGDTWLANKSMDFLAGMTDANFRVAVNRLRPHDEEGNDDFSLGGDETLATRADLDESLGDEHIEVASTHSQRFWIDAPTCAVIFKKKSLNPVLLAVELRRPDVLSVLLDGGEPKDDPCAKTSKSPLQVAIELPTELSPALAAAGVDSIAYRGLRASLIALLLSVGGGAKAMLARSAIDLPAERIGGSMLHLSVLLNDIVTTTLLLDAGADVNTVDASMSSALHVAVHIGAEDVVQLLLERQAVTILADSKGRTPLHMIADVLRVEVYAEGTDAERIAEVRFLIYRYILRESCLTI